MKSLNVRLFILAACLATGCEEPVFTSGEIIPCPKSADRYTPTGPVVSGWEQCGADECLFCCEDPETCTTSPSITCEPCAAVEAFRTGACADCLASEAEPACREALAAGADAYDPYCNSEGK